jgi:hypothetical protein
VLKNLKEVVGRVVRVRIPVVNSFVSKGTVEKVGYVWSCISWFLNSGFGSQDVDDFPKDLDMCRISILNK